jgi:hypothetical protein
MESTQKITKAAKGKRVSDDWEAPHHERRAAAVQTSDDPQKGSSVTFAIFAPFCGQFFVVLRRTGPAKNRANKENWYDNC